MNLDIYIEVPCCRECSDWMAPALLVAYPVEAVIWICLNGCASLMEGWGTPEEIPSENEQRALTLLAAKVWKQRH